MHVPQYKKIVLVMLICNLIFLFSSSVFAKSDTKVQKKSIPYSGEQIFRGLFLGQGPVAKLFPNIWSGENLKKSNTADAYKLTNQVISDMEKEDPLYFDNLKLAVESGNPIEVDNAFKIGLDSLEKQLNKDKVSLLNNSDVVSPNCAVAVVVLAGYEFVVLAQAGAVVTVGAAVFGLYLYVVDYGPGTSYTSNQMDRELFVNNAIDTLEAISE